jgi:hypothetical protein
MTGCTGNKKKQFSFHERLFARVKQHRKKIRSTVNTWDGKTIERLNEKKKSSSFAEHRRKPSYESRKRFFVCDVSLRLFIRLKLKPFASSSFFVVGHQISLKKRSAQGSEKRVLMSHGKKKGFSLSLSSCSSYLC